MKRISKRFLSFVKATWQILLIGLLVRLLLMPLATHSDLIQFYWKSHLITFHNEFAVGFQALLRLFHAGYLWVLTPVLPPADSLWIHHAENLLINPFAVSESAATQAWFGFISHPQIFRSLFLLKLPYLFFDLACAFLLYRLGSGGTKSRRMFKLWWLNPILIFAIYVFGRHEVIALFFIVLSIYLVRQGSPKAGLLSLGVAIAIRYYAVFLLPFYVLSMEPGWKKRVQGLFYGLIPLIILNLATWAFAGSIETTGLINLPNDDFLLSMKIQVAAWDNLYIFPLLYFLLLLHRLYYREYGLETLQRYCLIASLLLLATAYTGQSPQYWTWFLPFLVIGVAEDNRLLPLHFAQILLLAVYSFIGARATGGYLFAPISPDFFWALPSPVELISKSTSPEIVISLARTGFTAVTLWMAWLVARRMSLSRSLPPRQQNGI